MTRKPKAYRVRWELDPYAHFEECNGEARPLTAEEYAENPYMRDGETIPYAEYLEYYGNPARHVYLSCSVETQCPCCDSWETTAESVCGIDFMDDDRELDAIDLERPIAAMDAIALPGYAGDVALDLLNAAGMPAAKREARKRYEAQRKAQVHADAIRS